MLEVKFMNGQSPKVSVVVPIYKTETYLHKCIDSILAQTYTNLEVILVNDGSPDGCGMICDEYAEKDSRVKVIHKQNGGVSSARNAGLDIATGEYISFVDSDDYVECNMIEVLADNMISSGADLVVCNYNNVFPGNKTRINSSYENVTFGSIHEFEKLFVYYCGEVKIINSPWNKLYRRYLCGKFDAKVHFYEDLLFVLDYMRRCNKISVINGALYNYQHINTDSATMRYKDNHLEMWASLLVPLENFCTEVFSSVFDMNELDFLFCMDIEAVLRYYVACNLSYIRVYSKVKKGMSDKKFVDIINRVNYKPKTVRSKIKYFAAKKLIKNKLVVFFIIYAYIVSKAIKIKENL